MILYVSKIYLKQAYQTDTAFVTVKYMAASKYVTRFNNCEKKITQMSVKFAINAPE